MNSQMMRGVPKEELEKVREPVNRLLADPAMDYVRRAIKLQAKKLTSPDYENPAWAFKQAHHNGYNQALEDVLKLIESKG